MKKNVKNWMPWDIGSILLFFLLSLLPLGANNPAPLLSRAILFFIGVTGTGLLALHWPRRIKEHKERQRLLALPIIQEIGYLSKSGPKEVGRTYTSVNTGYSWNVKTGNIYQHYRYEEVGVYEGQKATFFKDHDSIVLNTLPRSFWGDEEQILFDDSDMSVSYVVDKNGKAYYISSRPA